ncbi:MAG: histidinol-phosphate transaminase [bacterium]
MISSFIRKSVEALEAYTPGEQPKQPGLIKLNTNENPYPPSPRVAEALAAIPLEMLRLYPDPVSSGLRQVIADLHGVGVDQVFVGNGSDEILALCTRAFVEDDGAIGYFTPSYSLYPVLTAIRNVAGAACELTEAFEWPAQNPAPASLFFLANPNAPTSMLFEPSKVRSFCMTFPGVVLVDEAYVDFARADCMEVAKSLHNVLVMRTLSKSYSLAGIRCGYVVGAVELISALFKIKDSYNLDRLTQAAATAALSDQAHMRANAARIIATRQRLAEKMKQLGFAVCSSDANFLWVRHEQPAKAIFESLKAMGILIRYFPGPKTGDYLRVTIGNDKDVDSLVVSLEAIFQRVTTRRPASSN